MTNKKIDIINAAIIRFIEDGDSFSTIEISKDVGCSQSLIFRYYGSKDGLIDACFDHICHDIRMHLETVPLPDEIDAYSFNRYMLDVWNAYLDYLESNSVYARAYVMCVSRGRRFPAKYGSPDKVLKRILQKHSDYIGDISGDSYFIAYYILILANGVALYLASTTNPDFEPVRQKINDVLMNGIGPMLGTQVDR